MKPVFLTAAVLGFAATAGHATEFDAAARSFLAENVTGWASDPVLLDAIRAQNAETAGYGSGDIDALDQTWRAEVGAASSSLIEPVYNNPAAEFLRLQADASGGVITEILLMDHKGLNVAVSHVTSDYWQGDEAKFTETYAIGPDAIHIGEIEFDESSQTYQSQLSFTITDPSNGEVLGAMTVGVNADALM
ncbi:hypothetical protein [Aestuariivita boseongensis]|uniref:hypothetical protein n=1 Tax=Aestuariivita boseongensis TaxID=1470562 RepID=UPI000682BC6D|nr:hypothetical protein [Aestuariivita boseongensis]